MRVVEADLLSVGGSDAGITAAICAARKDLNVTLVSMGKVGVSGNAIIAGGGFGIDGESDRDPLGMKDADPSFAKKRLFDCIVKESFFCLHHRTGPRSYLRCIAAVYLPPSARLGRPKFPPQHCSPVWTESLVHLEKTTGGEDFVWLLEQVPGT